MTQKRESRKIEQELYMNRKIVQLKSIYRQVQKDLSEKLKNIDISDFARARTQGLLNEVNVILKGLDVSGRKWAEEAGPVAYRRGFDLAADVMKRDKSIGKPNFDQQIHTQAVNTLVDDITVDLVYANQSIKKNVQKYIRLTQQRILEDKEISRMIAQGTIAGEARKTVSDSILEAFRKRLGDEQFITINGRNFRPDYYAELLARTRTREASSRGLINTALQYDVDLVQWSIHSNSCPICEKLQGKIFSISGNDPNFPQLSPATTPPAHPNCEHVITPVIASVLRKRGQYDELSRFSRSIGKISTFADFEEALA